MDTCFFNSPHQGTPLHWAADRGNVDTVRCLFDKGAEINIKADHNVGVSEWEYTADFKLALLISVYSPVTQPNEKERSSAMNLCLENNFAIGSAEFSSRHRGKNDLALILITMHYVGYTSFKVKGQ